MARFDEDATLSRQYVQLSLTSPRKTVDPRVEDGAPRGGDTDPPEAEWSLRRIERRIGSVA